MRRIAAVIACLLAVLPTAGLADGAAFCQQAYGALRYGAFDLAIDQFTKCLGAETLDTEARALAHHRRAIAFSRIGDFRHAVGDYSEAIRLGTADPAAHYNRGNAHFVLGDYDNAIADYGDVIRLSPGNADAYRNRCWALALVARAEEALAECARDGGNAERTARSHGNRAFVLWQLDRVDEARDALAAAQKLEPDGRFEPEAKIRSFTVILTQGLLRALGYRSDPANGEAGAATISAIEAFQRDRELDVTGAVSDDLLDALKAARVRSTASDSN